jgi:hypothetical protein
MTGKGCNVLRLLATLLAVSIVVVWLQPAFAATISFSGTVYNLNQAGTGLNLPVAGVTVQQAGKTSVTATTASDGTFTLTGLPSGTNFQLQITKTGYEKIYSQYINSTTNITGAVWTLLPANWMASVGNETGLGAIAGKVVDFSNVSAGISGVTVTAVNQASNSLPVLYPNGSTSTLIGGQFLVRNVNPGDVVTLTATKAGISFSPTQCAGYNDGATEPAVFGVTETTGTIWFTGWVQDPVSGIAIPGATVQLLGSENTTTTNTDGSYTLAGIPENTDEAIMITQSGYLPSYVLLGASSTNVYAPTISDTLWTASELTGFGYIRQGTPYYSGWSRT